MNTLIIIGAGGFGREVFQWARAAFDFGRTWRFKGFLDDNPAALSGTAGLPAEVIGGIDAYEIQPEDRFLCAIGRPPSKRRAVERILEKGGQFATLVHPSTILGANVAIGDGCILCPNVVVTCDVEIGRFVSLNVGTAVGHDAEIGDFTQASAFCDITGGVRLGRGVFMGSHASVLPRVSVGDDAVVGAGSVVVGNVKPGRTVFGNPAKVLRA